MSAYLDYVFVPESWALRLAAVEVGSAFGSSCLWGAPFSPVPASSPSCENDPLPR